MSGFAAVWNLDGAPVDETLLMRMQNFLSWRGPDEQRLVILGAQKNVGLVHAAFHTTPEAQREHQPCTIDSAVWLTGHVRLDAREQLSRDLRAHNLNLNQQATTDAQMVLQAYQIWGRSFIDSIIGDYSFVIFDEREQRLFAGRDHLGSRPLFYAQAGKSWILSNTLDCIRLNAEVSGELDDFWILDFLVKTRRADFERTAYREIKRLPPGHVLDLLATGGGIRKYWQLEVGDPIFYKKREEYFEHFGHVAKTVIKDRIRIGKVGICMSGGLDSTSIAAFLVQLVGDKRSDIVANCTYFENLIDDDECPYASAAADHLGISINFQNLDGQAFDPQWITRCWVPPEPNEAVFWHFLSTPDPDPFSNIRVVLIGHGPDDALDYMDWKPYLRWLLKKGRFIEFGSAVQSRLSCRPWPEIFSSLTAAFYEALPDLEKFTRLPHSRLDYQSSQGDVQSQQVDVCDKRHPWHPRAVSHFCSPVWQDFFDSFDPGFGARPIEAVHPYLDVRMVQFLLSLPVVPWCNRKFIIRESMRGLLPELVLARKKTPLVDDPWIKAMVRHPFPLILDTPELSRYVDPSTIPNHWAADFEQNRVIRRFVALQHWLAARDRDSLKLRDATKAASRSMVSTAGPTLQ